MPKTMRTITCCYCDAATLVDLARIGKGVLTCDACGARLASARMEAVMNKPMPVKRSAPKKTCSNSTLDPRWKTGMAGSFGPPRKVSKKKAPKRKGWLDRLEDIWDEIEDTIEDIID